MVPEPKKLQVSCGKDAVDTLSVQLGVLHLKSPRVPAVGVLVGRKEQAVESPVNLVFSPRELKLTGS